MPGSMWYAVLSGVALVISTWIASRAIGEKHEGEAGGKLAIIWLAALVGALVGAKLAFLLAEGWVRRDDWAALIGGRSVAGALLGGYAGVELAKRSLQWQRATGDIFAITVPLSLAIGRVGCVISGCCQGVECDASWLTVTDADGHARWPAAQTELVFNALFFVWALIATRCGWQREQRFHIYLIAYGVFRFAHEFVRDDPRWVGPIGGYHVVALALMALGAWGFVQRQGVQRSAAAS